MDAADDCLIDEGLIAVQVDADEWSLDIDICDHGGVHVSNRDRRTSRILT
ncbi:hypothetical protein [Burkholderia sp. MSMB1552]|nr:hypothetical protein [Burkholderia sp. MSMB1552]